MENDLASGLRFSDVSPSSISAPQRGIGMSTTQWIIGLVVALLAGGAMGAVINAVVSSYRDRIQPIGFKQESIVIVKKEANLPAVARLIVRENPFKAGAERSVENLSLARMTLVNKGNQDFEKFVFGITVDDGSRIIDFRVTSPDRYHVMKAITSRKPEDPIPEPLTQLDFRMAPFNRQDTYIVDVYFTYEDTPGSVELSTAHPIRFVELGLAGEKAKGIASGVFRTAVEKQIGIKLG